MAQQSIRLVWAKIKNPSYNKKHLLTRWPKRQKIPINAFRYISIGIWSVAEYPWKHYSSHSKMLHHVKTTDRQWRCHRFLGKKTWLKCLFWRRHQRWGRYLPSWHHRWIDGSAMTFILTGVVMKQTKAFLICTFLFLSIGCVWFLIRFCYTLFILDQSCNLML